MILHSLLDLKNFIQKEVLPQIKEGVVVLLDGELGAGKTQFVKTYCELIGTSEPVSSPTFSIIQEYTLQDKKIYHVDLYRIESASELENTGFWEIFENKNAIIFIEWPQKMDLSRIPKSWKILKINLELLTSERRIQFFT